MNERRFVDRTFFIVPICRILWATPMPLSNQIHRDTSGPQRVMVVHIKRGHNSSANEGLAVVACSLSLTDTILRRSISAFRGKGDVLGGGFV